MEQFQISLTVFPLISTHITSTTASTLAEKSPDSQQFLRNCKPIDHTKTLHEIGVRNGTNIYKVLDYELVKLRVSCEIYNSPFVFVKVVSVFYPILTLKYALALDIQNNFQLSVMPSQLILLYNEVEMKDNLIFAAYEVQGNPAIRLKFRREQFATVVLFDSQTRRQVEISVFERQAVRGVVRQLETELSIPDARLFVDDIPLNDDELILNYTRLEPQFIRLGHPDMLVQLHCIDGNRKIDFKFDAARTVAETKDHIASLIRVPAVQIVLCVGDVVFDDERMLAHYDAYVRQTIKIVRKRQEEQVKYTVMSHSINKQVWFLSSDWNIFEVRRRFASEIGIYAENCYCLKGGRVLDDERTVGEEGICKAANLVICYTVVDDVRQLAKRVRTSFSPQKDGKQQLVYDYGIAYDGRQP